MKSFLAILIALAPAWALADDTPVHTYDDGGTVIRLWDRPCVGGVAELIKAAAPESWQGRFKEVTSTFALGRHGDKGSQDYAGCWMEFTETEAGRPGMIVTIFEDGDTFIIPKESFKRHVRKGESET